MPPFGYFYLRYFLFRSDFWRQIRKFAVILGHSRSRGLMLEIGSHDSSKGDTNEHENETWSDYLWFYLWNILDLFPQRKISRRIRKQNGDNERKQNLFKKIKG